MAKIDPKLFATEMDKLSERFNHSLSNAVVHGYYQALASLSEDEFLRGCQKVFVENRFFPTPLELIHAALGSPSDLAQQEWMEVATAVMNNHKANISQTARQALTSIGGSVAIREGHGNLSMLRRDFITAYQALAKESQAQRMYPALSATKKELCNE
jgi:hypothetical protein